MTELSDDTRQLRPGLWETINERYPGSMITKSDFVPLARLSKPLSRTRLTFVSSAGIQPKGTMPFDVVHPVGDFSFRRVRSASTISELGDPPNQVPDHGRAQGFERDLSIERLQEMTKEGVIGELTPNLFSFIGYQMDPPTFERTLAEDIANAVVAEGAEAALLCPA